MRIRFDLVKRLFTDPAAFFDALDVNLFHYYAFFRRLERQGLVRFSRETRTFVREVVGHTFHLNPADFGISRDLARHGTREQESVESFRQHIHPDMTILDIGANVGFYVVQEAEMVRKGRGRVIAVEPAPDNVRVLTLNVEENGYSDIVTIRHAAVSDRVGTARLALSNHSNLHRLVELQSGKSTPRDVEVPTRTVEALMRSENLTLDDLDCLRMDVEGAEYMILPTLFPYLEGDGHLLMFVELHPTTDRDAHRAVLQKLESCGVTCLGGTKEYMQDGKRLRRHLPDVSMADLYTDDSLLQRGGCEVLLAKG